MKKTAFFLMIITILSKILGFGRELTLSYFYGASNITDAYLISMTIPTVMFGVIAVGIGTSYIPMYSKIATIEGSEEADKYTNNLINILLILSTLLFVLGLTFTQQLVTLFASGFEGETLSLGIRFTRISLSVIYFTALVHVLSGYLQIKNNYNVPASIAFPSNILIIVFIILSKRVNVVLLAVGIVVAMGSQLLLLYPFAYKKGYRYKAVFNIKDKYIKQMIYIALPVIVGVSVRQINVLVDRSLASGLAQGGITALNYADKINDFSQGIFVISISTALYPMISEMAAKYNIAGLKRSVSEAIRSVNLLIVPATVGMMIFAEPVVTLLFGRGQFDEQALAMTSTALFYYAIGMIGIGHREILSRAFYSMQDTKTPAINAAIAVVLNIILNIILSRFMGIGGLALATSISAIFGMVLLAVSFRKKVGDFGVKHITLSFIKIVTASLLMGLGAKATFGVLASRLSQNLALIVGVGAGVMIYGLLIYFMKIEEIDVLISKISRRWIK